MGLFSPIRTRLLSVNTRKLPITTKEKFTRYIPPKKRFIKFLLVQSPDESLHVPLLTLLTPEDKHETSANKIRH